MCKKICNWFRENWGAFLIALGLGAGAVISYTAITNRRRERTTDLPTQGGDSGEGSEDRVNDGIYSAIGGTVDRVDENVRKLEEYQLRARELRDEFEITIGDLAGKLEIERNRSAKFEGLLQAIRNSVNGVGGSIDRIGRLGSLEGISQSIEQTGGAIDGKFIELRSRSAEFDSQLGELRDIIGSFKREFPRADGSIPAPPGEV